MDRDTRGAATEGFQCLLTQETLFARLDKYNDACCTITGHSTDESSSLEKAKLIFSQAFVTGSEQNPKCKCGREILQHPSQHIPFSQVERGIAQFADRLHVKDFEGGLSILTEWARRDIVSYSDGPLCAPCKIQPSWGTEEWSATLRKGRKLFSNSKGVCKTSSLMFGICAGAGWGKTHALSNTKELLEATDGIYVAYNLEQQLKFDREHPRVATLLRVVLRHENIGISNCSCDFGFLKHWSFLENIEVSEMEDFVVWFLCDHHKKQEEPKAKHVALAIDEVCQLESRTENNNVVHQVILTLQKLSARLQQRHARCTTIVSALTEDTFARLSERLMVEKISIPEAGDNTRDSIVQCLLPQATDQHMAVIAACAGTHPQSIARACEVFSQEVEKDVDVQQLVRIISDRIVTHFLGQNRADLQRYVKGCVSTGIVQSLSDFSGVAPFADNNGVLPPSLVCRAFEKDVGMPSWKHPAQLLFETAVFIDLPMQLEQCAYQYDRFRALYGLPVVPYGVEVCNSGSLGAAWFEGLSFPKEISYEKNQNPNSLFVASKEVIATRTAERVKVGKYLFPLRENHPLIDRGCLAVSTDNGSQQWCLILYKDKVREGDMQGAVRGLNIAASLLSEGKFPVLCVVQIIASSSIDLPSQKDFDHAYILIREEEDFTRFFTPTFAPVLRFVRRRIHQLPV